MALSDILRLPEAKTVFLAEVTAGLTLRGWDETFKISGADVDCARTPLTETDISALKVNGTALTLVATAALCASTDNSWAYPGDGYLYVHIVVASVYVPAQTYGYTVVCFPKFYFSSQGKILNDRFYDGRIVDAPKLSNRIEEDFSGVMQIGGGSISFVNSDGYFDTRATYNWKAGETKLLVGADTASVEMVYEDYEAIATWVNQDVTKTDKKFTLTLAEIKTKIKKDIPFELYDLTTYPKLQDSSDGEPIPLAYGVILGARATCIDVDAKKFKLSKDAIVGIDDVRMASGSGSVHLAITTTDYANGEFTALGWDGTSTVTCDFRGKPDVNGVLIENAPDIIQDLLIYVGDATINAASFASAKAYMKIGTKRNNPLAVVYETAVGVYINSVEDLYEILSGILEASQAYLYCNEDGEYVLKPFKPLPGENLTELTDMDIRTFEEKTPDQDSYTRVVAQYANRVDEGWYQSAINDNIETQYENNESKENRLTKTGLCMSETDHADIWSQRTLIFNGKERKNYETTVGRIGYLLNPGDQLRLVYARHSLNKVLEVLSVNKNLTKGEVTLTLGNLHGFEDRMGFWVADDAVLPTRFSGEAGYGTGSLSWNASWSDTIKEWVRQNIGYWTDANGYTESTEIGYKPSCWI
jgi:hypothetical protein